MFFKYLIPALVAGSSLIATNETPWIDQVLLPITSLELGYQQFNTISSGNHYCRYSGRDFFGNTGMLFATSPDLCYELETRFTSTNKHEITLDQVKQTARYAYLDDARGDLVALTFGLALIEPIAVGLRDPSFIHHSLFDTELHVAIGKEWIFEDEYIWRTYALTAVGMGIEGYPWMRGTFTTEYNYCLAHNFKGKLIGEGGFGKDNLHLHHFHGYGNIAYSLVDVELEYTYNLECFDFSLRYLKSLYRHNCPANVQQISCLITYPFNL